MRILAPNSRYEHAPLALVEVDERDLAVLGETARFFQSALDPQSRPACFQALAIALNDAWTGGDGLDLFLY